jgi:hypothetical protein
LLAASSDALDSSQLEALEASALDGNANAAFALVEYYADRGPNAPENSVWPRIAAENGHVIGMTHYASDLGRIGGRHNCRRALFWIERASNSEDISIWVSNVKRFRDQLTRWKQELKARSCAQAFKAP